MSDDRSNASRPKKQRPRILVVNNPSPNSSDDERIILNNPPAGAHSLVSQYPPPLNTNLPDASRPYPSSNPSNPALSSPSSTSSRAFESTPPPSTPGQSTHPEDLCNEGTLRQEPVLVSYPDGSETITPPSASSQGSRLLDRLRFPNRPNHARRSSNNSVKPNTTTVRPPPHFQTCVRVYLTLIQSPTTSIPESYSSQTSGVSGSRSSPLERITLLVTTDAEHLVTVDVTGATDAAFIRERIFTKVRPLYFLSQSLLLIHRLPLSCKYMTTNRNDSRSIALRLAVMLSARH